MYIVYIIGTILILGLITTCIYLYRRNVQVEEKYVTQLELAQKEAAVSIAACEEEYKQKKQADLTEKEEHYKNIIRDLREKHTAQLIKSTKYIKSLEAFSKNKGEIVIHKTLTTLQTNLIHKNKITADDMIIMGNVFMPYYMNEQLFIRQIDHVVLMKTGIYVIEVKNWSGDILYGVRKDQMHELSFLVDSLSSRVARTEEQTFLFTKTSEGEIKVISKPHPGKEVHQHAASLKAYLQKLRRDIPVVTPIVYFNGDYNTSVKNYSQSHSLCFSTKDDLSIFFTKQLQNQPIYTTEDLKMFKETLEKASYHFIHS